MKDKIETILKEEQTFDEHGTLSGKTMQVMVDEKYKETVNNTINNFITKMFFELNTNAERTAAIKEIAKYTSLNFIDDKDGKIQHDKINDALFETIDATGLEFLIEAAAFHSVYYTPTEDYIGSYFSISYYNDYGDEETLIVNDLIDFWGYARNDKVYVFPHRNDKLNYMIRKYFVCGDGKIAAKSYTKMTA